MLAEDGAISLAQFIGDLGQQRRGEALLWQSSQIAFGIGFLPHRGLPAEAPQAFQRRRREQIVDHHHLRACRAPAFGDRSDVIARIDGRCGEARAGLCQGSGPGQIGLLFLIMLALVMGVRRPVLTAQLGMVPEMRHRRFGAAGFAQDQRQIVA